MKLKLQTERGNIFLMNRDDGHDFLAVYIDHDTFNTESPLEAPFWTLWLKGQMETKLYFKCFRELMRVLVDGWLPSTND